MATDMPGRGAAVGHSPGLLAESSAVVSDMPGRASPEESVAMTRAETGGSMPSRASKDLHSAMPEPLVVPSVEAPAIQDAEHDLGFWEVHTVKKGWAPLAPALQPALDV